MHRLNKIIMFLLFLVLMIIGSAMVYAAIGCCTNPGAGIRLCSENLVLDAVCCPQPESENEGYYESELNPFGPVDYAECNPPSGAGFFYTEQACSSVNDCETGCCCEPLGGSIKTRIECQGTGVTFNESTSNCNEICHTPQCSDGVNNDPGNNDCADEDDTACGDPYDPYDDSESGGVCWSDLVGVGCDSTSYVPKLDPMSMVPVSGEKKFSIRWNDECSGPDVNYEVYRCRGDNCDDFELIGTSTVESFIDDSDELLFWVNYTYKVKAHYTIQTAEPTIKETGGLGDLECWNQEIDKNFCIYAFYYDQYRDYLINNFDGFSNDFEGEVNLNFGSEFNTPFYCSNWNNLIKGGAKCGDDEICIVKGAEPECIDRPVCNYPEANPFGLYYEEILCESNDKYCFYDRSFSIANSCFACNPSMSCYDYKSRGSCEKDNCGIGEGNCGWRDLPGAGEFGTGVCVNMNRDNCEWCGKAGTEDVGSSMVTSKVFEGCTREKTEKLSTLNHKCFFNEGKAKSCEDVVCTDYEAEECSSSQIRISSTNGIENPSNDACGIGVCQLFSGNCMKNADGNTEADCGTEACEKDYFKPDTQITPVSERGLYKSLNIRRYDKTSSASAETLRTSKDYKTYLCKDCSGGHPFEKFTNSNNLIISNLNVFDSDTGDRLLRLSEGNNRIKYYSEDPSKNIGLVKTLLVEAHGNTSGPLIYRVNITRATKVEDTYYTNSPQLKITIEFFEEAVITHALLVNKETGRTINPSYNDGFLKIFVFDFDAMDNGEYLFELNARNENNIYMDRTYLLDLVIDYTPLNAVIDQPEEGALLEESSVPVRLTFNKESYLISVLVYKGGYANEYEDFVNDFSSADNIVFTATLNLDDGNKVIEIRARDYAGNELNPPVQSSFIVNANPLAIEIKEPSYGVAPDYTFDIVVETDNDAECRYNFNDNMEYEFMDPFGVTGGVLHSISSFSQIPPGSSEEYFLYVKCNDPLQGSGTAVFKLRVDETPPEIEKAYAFPNPVVERPPDTKLIINTDEETICKYGSVADYGSMESEFPFFDDGETGYRTVHRKNMSLPDSGSLDYYVGCENLAGLVSVAGQPIQVRIDLDASLIITDHTPDYFDSITVNLAVGTNKKAQCKYSSTDPSVLSGNIFGSSSYDHVKAMALNNGEYKYYVKCKDQYLQQWSSVVVIEFTIDTSPPLMDYVNDSSKLKNPEVSWMTNRLRVKWLAEDNNTEINHYLYTLEEFGSLKTIVNWTISGIGDEWLWITELNLTDSVKYYFRVKAKNMADLESDIKESDGVTVDINAKPTDCTNGVKEPFESDIDCGGPCEPCENNQRCDINIDCKSGYCEDGICEATSCDDNIKQESNGESDIDCGGDVCIKCDDGKECHQDSDCRSNYCGFGTCKEDTCYDDELSSSEGDVDCGGPCSVKCDVGMSCSSDGDCVSAARCIKEVCTVCAADDADCNGVPDDMENDQDGDGMDDDWELRHGFDPNDPSDGLSDADGDGLTNLQEFRHRTDPNIKDTDGDGYSDGDEVNKYGTDPTKKSSKPQSKFWLVVFMLLGGVLAGGLGFVVYHRVALKKKIELKPTGTIPRFAQRPVRPAVHLRRAQQIRQMRTRTIQKKRGEEKKGKREKVFEAFDKEKKEAKEEGAKEKETRGKQAAEKTKKSGKRKEIVKETKSDAFAKLSKMASKDEGQTKEKKAKGEAFRKLKKISKEKKKK